MLDLTRSIFGNVVGIRRHSQGDIEIDFFHDEDDITELRYSSNLEKSNLTKELAESLCVTLATDICAEVFLDDNDKVTHIEFEECDYEDEEE